jgi:glycosyltransferase involved in cell wall biosynthesis
MSDKKKIIRIATVPLSLDKLLENQLNYINQFYEVTAVSSNEEELIKIGKKEGVAIFDVELTRVISPFKDLKAVIRLFRFLKKEKPLIVHTHTPKAGTLGMMASKLAGVPIRMHTVAGLPLLEIQGKKRKLLNFVEKITYACATKVYPNSFELKDIIIIEGFCNPQKLKVLGNGSSNGINTSYFDPSHYSEDQKNKFKATWNISADDFVFIYVGRIVKDKGINELVNAFKRLCNKYNNIKLLLVGPFEPELDPLLPETETIIKENDKIITTGFQTDVRPFFLISDLLVFPSYREGFPNVVMQAGAMDLPSIVSNINGCNEIIIDGKNGVIIPAKDDEALYQKMEELFIDKPFYATLKANARKMIVDRYKQEVIWKAILEEYRSEEQRVESEIKKKSS